MFPVEVQIGTKSKEFVPWLRPPPPPYHFSLASHNFHFRPVLQDLDANGGNRTTNIVDAVCVAFIYLYDRHMH
jgi:hypothetical protein